MATITIVIVIAALIGHFVGYNSHSGFALGDGDVSGYTQTPRESGGTEAVPRQGGALEPLNPQEKVPPLTGNDDERSVLVTREILSRLALPILSGDGRTVSPLAKKTLNLTPDEVSSLEDRLDVTLQELARLELANTEVEARPGGAIEVNVNKFVDEGRALRQRLAGSIQDILGVDRAAVFETGFRSPAFSEFGQSPRLLIATPNGDPSSPTLFTLEEHFLEVSPGKASSIIQPVTKGDAPRYSGARALPFAYFEQQPDVSSTMQ